MASSVRFVFVPCDPERALEEWTEPVLEGKEVESVLDRCKAHYRATQPPPGGAAAAERLRGVLGEDAAKTADPALLEHAAQMLLVESVALLPGGPKNGFSHVNLYCDDQATLKGLPPNARATALAREAGLDTAVCGDAFVGRVVDDSADVFRREDFTLAEVAHDAPWLADAREANVRRRAASTRAADLAASGGATVVGATGGADEPVEMAAKAGERYAWRQDDDEVTVEVDVPAGTRGKDVRCKIGAQSLLLEVATLPEGERVLVDGTLFQRVVLDESAWSVGDDKGQRRLTVTLTKEPAVNGKAMRWLALLR